MSDMHQLIAAARERTAEAERRRAQEQPEAQHKKSQQDKEAFRARLDQALGLNVVESLEITTLSVTPAGLGKLQFNTAGHSFELVEQGAAPLTSMVLTLPSSAVIARFQSNFSNVADIADRFVIAIGDY